MNAQNKFTPGPAGRSALCWLVVNPDGKLLAVLDSESEAYFFTRNRGHAAGAVYFLSPCDYAAAPDMLAVLQDFYTWLQSPAVDSPTLAAMQEKASRAIAKAKGQQ